MTNRAPTKKPGPFRDPGAITQFEGLIYQHLFQTLDKVIDFLIVDDERR